eukprot:1593646-Rhodomonas_salina.1
MPSRQCHLAETECCDWLVWGRWGEQHVDAVEVPQWDRSGHRPGQVQHHDICETVAAVAGRYDYDVDDAVEAVTVCDVDTRRENMGHKACVARVTMRC